MTATNAAPEPRRPEFWEETGSGFRLSVFASPTGTYWAEVYTENPGDDSPPLHQTPAAPTSELAASMGRAFIAGARFLADDAADAIASADGESSDQLEIASVSLSVNTGTIRRLFREMLR